MELSKLKLPSISNNFLIWGVIIFIILAFGAPSGALGVNFLKVPNENQKNGHKNLHDNKSNPGVPNKSGVLPIPALGNSTGILGGNGMFIIAVVVLLFLCKDKEEEKEKEEAVDDTPVVDYTEIED